METTTHRIFVDDVSNVTFRTFSGKAISINRTDASTVNLTKPERRHALDTDSESVRVYYLRWQREAKTGTD